MEAQRPEPEACPVHELSEEDLVNVHGEDREKVISALLGDTLRQDSSSGMQDEGGMDETEHELSYRSRFLVNDGARSRVTTAIDRNVHQRMKALLVLAAPEVSIVSYISNVLEHHLEQFEDEINELYEKPLTKLRK